jgi:hypothetical protein
LYLKTEQYQENGQQDLRQLMAQFMPNKNQLSNRRKNMMILQEPVLNRKVNAFSYQVAIINVQPGETNEHAWIRHLVDYPQDSPARVKVFNRLFINEDSSPIPAVTQ